jgi:hypothetical protein
VFHKMSLGVAGFLSQRYHYSRSDAGMRTGCAPLLTRVLYAGFCPFLPALVLGRIGNRVWRKGRWRGKLLQTLPLLILFSLAWAWGEFCGYLFGLGESLQKVGSCAHRG